MTDIPEIGKAFAHLIRWIRFAVVLAILVTVLVACLKTWKSGISGKDRK